MDAKQEGRLKSGCWSLAYILGYPAAAPAAAPRGPCEVFYIFFLHGGLLYCI